MRSICVLSAFGLHSDCSVCICHPKTLILSARMPKFDFKPERILYAFGVHSGRIWNGYSEWIPDVLRIQTEF